MLRVSILTGNGATTGFAYPEMMVEVCKAHAAGNVERAHDVFDTDLPLARYEQQPNIGLAARKYLTAKRGVIASAALRKSRAQLTAADVADIERLVKRQATRARSAEVARSSHGNSRPWACRGPSRSYCLRVQPHEFRRNTETRVKHLKHRLLHLARQAVSGHVDMRDGLDHYVLQFYLDGSCRARDGGPESCTRPGDLFKMVARLGPLRDDHAVCGRLAEVGVTARPLSGHYFAEPKAQGLFLGFAAWNESEIDTGVQTLARVMRSSGH